MPEQTFREFQSHLLNRGVTPKHVRRITAELRDHLGDLRREAIERGLPLDQAEQLAIEQLGDPKLIAQQVLVHAEVRAWIYRYPRVARIYLPLAYVLLMPAQPVIVGFRNPATVVRWGSALMLGAAITAAMFLFMQLSIVLT